MALQFRRGLNSNLPSPSDAAIGEPLFTTDDGKLRIKKDDGTYAVIGSGTTVGNLDLSGIAADSLVKVNAQQDGFVAAAGGDLPSHTHAIANVTGLQGELDLKADLADFPQNPPGTLDIAQESTLLDFSRSAVRVKTDNTVNITVSEINQPNLPLLSVLGIAATPTSDASVIIAVNTGIGITDPSAPE